MRYVKLFEQWSRLNEADTENQIPNDLPAYAGEISSKLEDLANKMVTKATEAARADFSKGKWSADGKPLTGITVTFDSYKEARDLVKQYFGKLMPNPEDIDSSQFMANISSSLNSIGLTTYNNYLLQAQAGKMKRELSKTEQDSMKVNLSVGTDTLRDYKKRYENPINVVADAYSNRMEDVRNKAIDMINKTK